MTTLTPADAAEAAEAVAQAAADRASLSIVGLGSKAALGRPWNAERRLDLSRLSGVTTYEPAELVLCARAATPLAEIEALLAANGQELAFEPMSFDALYGAGRGSIGGALMANLSGPRRVKAGAARDHILGLKAIDGRGAAYKAGGTVVKNVTGYDLARGLAGSYGALAVVTEVNFKVLPRAQTATTLMLPGLAPKAAVAALCAAMGAPVDVSGAAHLPAYAAKALGFPAPATLLRLEGFSPSVDERFDRLRAQLADFAAGERLDAQETERVWRAVRDVVPLAQAREKIIWRVSVAPTSGPAVAAAVQRALGGEAMFDWSGGLVWLALDPDAAPDGGAELVRGAVAVQEGGHATLIRAPDELRARAPVFQPPPPALEALSRRLKAQFDPWSILERGRLRAAS